MQQRNKSKIKHSNWPGRLLILSLLLILSVVGAFCWFYAFYYKDIVEKVGLDDFRYQPAQKTTVYSADDVLLAELFNENRRYVDIQQISPEMQKTIVAIEDHRFYKHHGVDVLGTMRALLENMRSKQVVQGGSTITQQLARNLFLTSERTYDRKLKEAALAIALERKYTKDEILCMYLNQIYFGSGYYGVEIAAQRYFGKSADQLNLAESALLAAIPNQPSQYELHDHLDNAKQRQQLVLERLQELGQIEHSQYLEAMQTEVRVLPRQQDEQQSGYRHPYFTTAVLNELEQLLDGQQVYYGGLVVHTTLNTKIQKVAENTVANSIRNIRARGISAGNMALVSVVPQTGAVAALVGGVDFNADQNNLALTPRQPGSTIKPFIYAAALNSGYIQPYSSIDATPKKFSGYFIKNPGNWQGAVSVQTSIKHSLNVPVAEMVKKMGTKKTVAYLESFGISTVTNEDHNYAALALGGMYYGISPLELTAAYGVFANGGMYNKPYLIEEVTDSTGKVIYQHNPTSRRVLTKETASTMHRFLKGVVNGGTGSSARIPWESAGKTGTTDDGRCLWFAGYTNNLATAIWIGNNDNTPVRGGGSGGAVAGPVWKNYMTAVIRQKLIATPARLDYLAPSLEKPDEEQTETTDEEELEDLEDLDDSKPDESEEQPTEPPASGGPEQPTEPPKTWLPKEPPPTPEPVE